MLCRSQKSNKKALEFLISMCNCLNCNNHCDDHIFIQNLYFCSSHHLHVSFLSRVKINSTNWPAPNVWVFTAQMVEHCSANAEAMGSSPVEFPQNFFGFICNCSSCDHHSNDHIFIQNLYFCSSHHLHVSFLSRVKMNSTNWPAPNVWVFIAQW